MKRKKSSKKEITLFNTPLKKKFITVTSTLMAVFVVVSIVGATTTVGLNISTDGNLTVSGNTTTAGNDTLGDASTDLLTVNSTANFVNQLQASSTALFSGAVTDYSTLQVNATTTLNGAGADLVVGGVSTSTFAGTVKIGKTAATTTLQVGRSLNTTAGQGGCIALQDTAGTGGFIYLFYDSTKNQSLQLATSTNSKVCFP